jgi:hypothetical protein
MSHLVEARKLDWNIAGYEGNRRHAINREHYCVQVVWPDGGLEVAVVEATPALTAGLLRLADRPGQGVRQARPMSPGGAAIAPVA